MSELRLRQPRHGAVVDWVVDDGGGHSEHHAAPEDGIVIADTIVHDAAQPDAEEAADLIYHLLVLLKKRDTNFDGVLDVLAKRRE